MLRVVCGALYVEDRPGRVESVMQLLIQAEEKGILSPPMAPTLKGKLRYTRSQTFGRAGGPGLQALGCCEAGLVWQALPLGDLVQHWTKHFEVREPGRLLIGNGAPLWLVGFTDGAVETVDDALVVTIGGVLFDPLSNKPPSFFAERVQEKKVQESAAANTRHLVFQAEVFLVAVAARTWRGQIADRDVFGFFDNEAARFAIIKGYTPILSAARLLGEAWLGFAAAGAAESGLQGSRQEAIWQMHLLGLYRPWSGSRST